MRPVFLLPILFRVKLKIWFCKLLEKEQQSLEAQLRSQWRFKQSLIFGKKGSPDFVHPARDVFPPCYRVKWKGRSTLQSNSQELCLAFRSTLVQPLRMRGHRNNERGTAVRCVNKGWKWHDTSLKKFTGGFKTHTTALNRSTWSLD